jgi:hypothetical protein
VKVLVCGSRLWTKREPIERELLRIGRGESTRLQAPIVVHGAHWEGADHLADQIANAFGYEVRRYPANWTLYGPSAGPRRNAQMILKEHVPSQPIDLCLAFADDFKVARGTDDMRRKATAAGIRVESFSS